MALNEEPAKPMDLGVDPGSCGRFQLEREFSFTGVNGLAPVRKPSPPPRIHSRLAPWSIHVLELKPAAR